MPNLSPIVILLGPSSSGKDSIATKLKEIDKDSQAVWKEESKDELTLKVCYDVLHSIETNADDAEHYKYALNILHFTKVFQAIIHNETTDRESLPKRLEDFVYRSIREHKNQAIYSAEDFYKALSSLQYLVLKYHDHFQSFAGSFKTLIHNAIQNSISGHPTIINMVLPIQGDFKDTVMDLLESTIQEQNHKGLIYKFIIHTPVSELKERMLIRNQIAKESDHEEGLREGIFPLQQYAKLFGTFDHESELGILSDDTVVDFCGTFGGASLDQASILEQLHLNARKTGGVFFRYPDSGWQVFNNTKLVAPETIAKEISQMISINKCAI